MRRSKIGANRLKLGGVVDIEEPLLEQKRARSSLVA